MPHVQYNVGQTRKKNPRQAVLLTLEFTRRMFDMIVLSIVTSHTDGTITLNDFFFVTNDRVNT